MTLDTRIVAITPCDAHDLFYEMRLLLGADERVPIIDEPNNLTICEGLRTEGSWSVGHPINQGLPALLEIHYRPKLEPYRTPQEANAHNAGCDTDCDGGWHHPACWVEVSIDTSYGYCGDGGETCSMLHARLVFELGQWLDEREIKWGFFNEFRCEWHFEDRYAALKELAGDGGPAVAWFSEIVQPVIEQTYPEVVWHG